MEPHPAPRAQLDPAPSPAVEVVFVDSAGDVGTALTTLTDTTVGMDVERADGDRYFRSAALVQVGVAGRCVLFDATTIADLSMLGGFLEDRLAVLHAVENDLDPLRSVGVVPARIADTAVAAAILGLPTGLGPLLSAVLGVELDGDKSAYQRADWEQRPLSAGMAAYAAGDVVHLPALWEQLTRLLADAGRRAWYDEELAWVVEHADDDTRDWTRVKSAGRLTPGQRATLRVLWETRESLAREHDIAPNRLLHEEVLVDLATDPPRTARQLVRRSHRRRSFARRFEEQLFAAVELGLDAAPETRERARRWTDGDRAVYDALRRRRSEVALELGIDPGVLCPSRSLWAPIAAEPDDGAALCSAAGLRAWQASVLAGPLWDAYTTTTRRAADDPSSSASAAD